MQNTCCLLRLAKAKQVPLYPQVPQVPRYIEPVNNEKPGITNEIFQPSNSAQYEKEPR